jgi:hypothetical protein
LRKTNRKIHFELSNKLPIQDATTWQTYANSWRTTSDIESYLGIYPLTRWDYVLEHFHTASQWTHFAVPGSWNDADSLEIGNDPDDGTNDGTINRANFFNKDDRQSLASYWAIIATPLLLGTDLTQNLDPFDLSLLQNDEVIAMNQAGIQGAPIDNYLQNAKEGRTDEVWRAKQLDASYTVLMTNSSNAPTPMALANWTNLGFTGPAIVRDIWNHQSLVANPKAQGGYQFINGIGFPLRKHQSKLLKVTPLTPITQYLAEGKSAVITGAGSLNPSNVGTHGTMASLKQSAKLTFKQVYAGKTGRYTVSVLYNNGNSRAVIDANGGSSQILNFPGSGELLGTVTTQLPLRAGYNTISITSSKNGPTPHIDSINIQANTTLYEADQATLTGNSIKIRPNATSTDGRYVTGIGYSGLVSFKSVKVQTQGIHQIILLYANSQPSSAELSVNGINQSVSFPPTSMTYGDNSRIGAITLQVNLQRGNNTITIGNRVGWAAALDSIIVAE